ncbi:MAG: hypothetical protein QOI74_4014 [Micromonosporaceae bacterium]|jgi:deazaflavin-dependent oxidoreductase (nitroreductase family)|nr:hypothetical protein [Micromonosporaceae bacterium]MDT5035880.1 hypothetical protein [Micromonosporaceae bacterium]
MAQLNRRVANPLLRPVARLLPPFAIVEHTGRVSGRRYRTPVFAFRRDGEIVIVLSYGRNSQWAENLLSAGRGVLIRGRRRYTLSDVQVRTVDHSGPLSALGRFSSRFGDHVLVADLRDHVD